MTDAALRHTPFHEALVPLNKIQAWERWQGYATVPCFYNRAVEYAAIRNSASLYDISPMVKYHVTGPDASRFINRLITRDIDRCQPGQCLYAPWCDGEGHIIEDGTVFRFSRDRFQINSGEHNLLWFLQTAEGLEVDIEDVSERIAAVALQGPLSREILLRLGVGEVAGLKYFGLLETRVGALQVTLTRTGFTGDLGYELWVDCRDAMTLWSRLAEVGEERLTPIGSHALDIARIEAGHIQVNSEYQNALASADAMEKRSPYELGLGWALNFKKDHFNGRRALLAQKQGEMPPLRLVGLELPDRQPATDCVLYAGRRVAGQVTAATWSPLLKKSIALALVEARWAVEGTLLWVEIHHRRELRLLTSEQQARVVPPGFMALARRRQ